MTTQRFSISAITVAKLEVFREYLKFGMPAAVILYIGTNVVPRLASPYSYAAEVFIKDILAWWFTASIASLFIVSLVGTLWIGRLVRFKRQDRT